MLRVFCWFVVFELKLIMAFVAGSAAEVVVAVAVVVWVEGVSSSSGANCCWRSVLLAVGRWLLLLVFVS